MTKQKPHKLKEAKSSKRCLTSLRYVVLHIVWLFVESIKIKMSSAFGLDNSSLADSPKKVLVAAIAYADDSPLKTFKNANLRFTAKLYKELIKTNTTPVLVCPLSAQLIFSLLHAGAKGKTAEQIATGLSLPNDNAAIQTMAAQVLATFKTESYYTVIIANKVFVKDGFEVKKDFIKTAVDGFKSDVENVNFSKGEQAAKTINDWVKSKTDGTIHDIIGTDDIEDTLRMVLVNTIYIQVHWMNSFTEDATKSQDFYISKNKTIQVDMMKDTEMYEYYECGDLNAKFLRMKYQAPHMAMVVVLPNEKDGLEALENRIEDVLNHSKFDLHRVNVEFPKFKMDTAIKLNPILKTMGITEPFTTDADLTGISYEKNLFVSKTVQKNHIEVNEKGTIASSATAIFDSLNMAFITDVIKDFAADHPFIYYIQSKSGVMFIGKYTGK